MCRVFWNLGASTSWNPQGLSRPVMGLLCFYQSLSTGNWVRETCTELVLIDIAFLILFNWADPNPVMPRFIFHLKQETTNAVPSVNDTKCDTPSWLEVFRTIILKIQVIWNVKPCHLVQWLTFQRTIVSSYSGSSSASRVLERHMCAKLPMKPWRQRSQ
jgi:hypothetical protein